MASSKAQIKANLKYKKNHYKRVPLEMQITEYEKLKSAADSKNESVNGYIKKAINERIEREQG